MKDDQFPVRAYVGALAVSLVALLAWASSSSGALARDIPAWVALSVLFGATEYAQVYFHDERARFGLTGSESVLTVMIVGLTFPQILWGVVVAIAVERLIRRTSGMKLVFNVAQYGLAAGAAGGLWRGLSDAGEGFTVRNAFVAAAAVLVFAILTHVLTAIVIALVERRPILQLSRSVASATVLNLVGSVVLGLLFAAAYENAAWTLALFPLPILGLYLGYTAALRTQRERDRVEHLYAATRALASSRNVDESITEFLRAVADIVAAPDVRLVLRSEKGDEGWTVQRDVIGIVGEDVTGSVLSELVDLVAEKKAAVVVGEAEEGQHSLARILEAFEARTLVATPLISSGVVVGCLVTAGRVGAEDFNKADARLLEALANELVVSLDSYRLFAEIIEERERFGRIFAGSKEGICLLDGDGCVRAWNPALERISGYTSDEVMNKIWSDVLTIRDREEDRVRGDELVGIEADEELELVTKAGPSRWVTLLAGPVGEAEDGGWVVLMRDVTAEHEVEAAKSDFLSTISHELRTPLTTIKGSLQVLSRGPENLPPDLAGQMIGVTTRGAERLERLVMNLLAVSQIESGTMPVFPDALDLEAVVKERMNALLKDHHQTTFEGVEGPLIVRADRERMSHTVEHLLENAQKFGGPEGEIKIQISQDAGFARLSITDQGPGIPTGDQERVFDRFVRLGDVLTRETQGAGIGLFIAKRSVEAMGGRIWVESKLGEGSTFHVTIPMARPMAVADEADSA